MPAITLDSKSFQKCVKAQAWTDRPASRRTYGSGPRLHAETQLLIDNPIDRYLINAPMLPDLKKNADGSLTIYMQKDSPGAVKESNWLPAPDGAIYMVMRIYWPKEAALNGSWKPPVVQLTK